MNSPDARIACLLLAAGGGTRLGGGKLLLPWHGKPLVAYALETALRVPDLSSIAVVFGHEARRVRQALRPYVSASPVPLRFADNPHWRQGQSSSLRRGIESLRAARESLDIQGVLVLLGDQPLVREQTLCALLAAHRLAVRANAEHPATVPVYRGNRGNPVILSHVLFPQLLELQGDVGARRLLRAPDSGVLHLPVDDPGILHDIDTAEAYADLCARRTPDTPAG